MAEFTIRDARTAGMVLHPSTEGALTALSELSGLNPARVLDIGCGSGLLTLAACEVWPQAQVLAADIHPQAVRDAEANLAGRARVLRADGLRHPEIQAGAPYQLMLCNLLAEILVRLAPEVKAHLDPQGGVALLAGILPWMAEQVRLAYQAEGLEIIAEIQVEEWVVIVLCREE